MLRPLLTLVFLIFAAPAHAQVNLSRVFPNGARQGTRVKVTLGGENLPETGRLIVDGDGIEPVGPFTKGEGEVEIAPDAAPGVRQIRLVGPKAATTPRPFAIGTLPEMAEKEPNDRVDQAQRIDSLPVTINGSLPTRPDIDTFRVALKKGQCLVVAGESRALGAPTNLLVRVRDVTARELVVQMDYRTRDPLLGFTAPADGDYLVELQEVMNNYSNLSADYVYRVTLTTGPWIDYAFPPGAQRGTTAHLMLAGWNLGGQSGPTRMPVEVPIPPDAPAAYLISGGGSQNRVPLAIGDVPEVLEQRAAGAPQTVSVPVTVSGTFDPGDRDVYRFTARAGETLRLAVESRELDSFADPTAVLLDSAFKSLATADDSEGTRDPRFYWTFPADGEYRLVLRDATRGSRGGAGFFYRVTIAPPEPVLGLTTKAGATLVLKPGATLEVPVSVYQAYQPAELKLTVEGLPAGVTADPVTVNPSPKGAGTTEVKLVLTAAGDFKPASAEIRIVAQGGPAGTVYATWDLSTDRSGTLATGRTDRLLLLSPAP